MYSLKFTTGGKLIIASGLFFILAGILIIVLPYEGKDWFSIINGLISLTCGAAQLYMAGSWVQKVWH